MSRGKHFNYSPYKISKARYLQLCDDCASGRYSDKILHEACRGLEFVEKWIILSVTKNKSYDRIERSELDRIPASRTSFYRYRRLFYYNLNALLKGECKR